MEKILSLNEMVEYSMPKNFLVPITTMNKYTNA